MKRVIYLPDALGHRLKTARGFNVSAVCQQALRTALDQHDTHERSLAALERLWR